MCVCLCSCLESNPIYKVDNNTTCHKTFFVCLPTSSTHDHHHHQDDHAHYSRVSSPPSPCFYKYNLLYFGGKTGSAKNVPETLSISLSWSILTNYVFCTRSTISFSNNSCLHVISSLFLANEHHVQCKSQSGKRKKHSTNT